METDWIKSYTLGAKSKPFEWTYNSNRDLCIHRKFKGENNNFVVFNEDEVDEIINYVFQNEIVRLANSVSKLHSNEEIDDLGKFVYKELGKTIEEAQVVSQLAALFTKVKVFEYNGKLRNMEFRLKNPNWKNA